MEDQGHAQGLERRTRQFRPVLRGRGRQLRPAHMREAAARAFEHAAALHDAGDAIALQALAGALAPGVGQKACTALAFHLLQRLRDAGLQADRKSTRLNSSHLVISYAVFCLKKKKNKDMYRLHYTNTQIL